MNNNTIKTSHDKIAIVIGRILYLEHWKSEHCSNLISDLDFQEDRHSKRYNEILMNLANNIDMELEEYAINKNWDEMINEKHLCEDPNYITGLGCPVCAFEEFVFRAEELLLNEV